jgi:hypothetical protein
VAAWLQILGERHDEILHEVNVHGVNVHAVDVSNKTKDMTSRLLLLLLLLTLHPAIFRQHKHVPDVRGHIVPVGRTTAASRFPPNSLIIIYQEYNKTVSYLPKVIDFLKCMH